MEQSTVASTNLKYTFYIKYHLMNSYSYIPIAHKTVGNSLKYEYIVYSCRHIFGAPIGSVKTADIHGLDLRRPESIFSLILPRSHRKDQLILLCESGL